LTWISSPSTTAIERPGTFISRILPCTRFEKASVSSNMVVVGCCYSEIFLICSSEMQGKAAEFKYLTNDQKYMTSSNRILHTYGTRNMPKQKRHFDQSQVPAMSHNM
jgi:hypothetical protein